MKYNGGPAFPGPDYANGMSLRDYFAGQVLSGMVVHTTAHEVNACDKTGLTPIYTEGDPSETNRRIAEWSYAIADAMLAARKDGQ